LDEALTAFSGPVRQPPILHVILGLLPTSNCRQLPFSSHIITLGLAAPYRYGLSQDGGPGSWTASMKVKARGTRDPCKKALPQLPEGHRSCTAPSSPDHQLHRRPDLSLPFPRRVSALLQQVGILSHSWYVTPFVYSSNVDADRLKRVQGQILASVAERRLSEPLRGTEVDSPHEWLRSSNVFS